MGGKEIESPLNYKLKRKIFCHEAIVFPVKLLIWKFINLAITCTDVDRTGKTEKTFNSNHLYFLIKVISREKRRVRSYHLLKNSSLHKVTYVNL